MSRRRQVSGVLLVGAALTSSVWVLAPLVNAGLDPVDSLVSELSASDQPAGWLFRLGDLVSGSLCLAAVLLLRPEMPRMPWLTLARGALGVFAVCTMLDPFLPVDCAVTVDATCRAAERAGQVSVQHQLHSVTGTIESFAAVLVTAGLWLGLRWAPGWTGRARLWFACTVLLGVQYVAVVVLYFAGAPATGLVQRGALVVWSVALAVAGVSLWAERDRQWPRPEPVEVPPGRVLEIELPGSPGRTVVAEVHEGRGPAGVVFCSGMGLPRQVWYPVLAHLPDITTVLMDRPGMGTASAGPTADRDLAEQAGEIAATVHRVRADLGVSAMEHLVLVGHSHGATLAEAVVRLHPSWVRGLLLVDPSDPRTEAAERVPATGLRWARWCVAGQRRASFFGHLSAWAVRAVGTSRPDAAPLPDAARASLATSAHLQGTLDELAGNARVSQELLALASHGPIRGTEVAVLVAERRGWPRYGSNARWVNRLTERAGSLPALVTTMPVAHLVSLDDPEALATGIRSLVGRVVS